MATESLAGLNTGIIADMSSWVTGAGGILVAIAAVYAGYRLFKKYASAGAR